MLGFWLACGCPGLMEAVTASVSIPIVAAKLHFPAVLYWLWLLLSFHCFFHHDPCPPRGGRWHRRSWTARHPTVAYSLCPRTRWVSLLTLRWNPVIFAKSLSSRKFYVSKETLGRKETTFAESPICGAADSNAGSAWVPETQQQMRYHHTLEWLMYRTTAKTWKNKWWTDLRN